MCIRDSTYSVYCRVPNKAGSVASRTATLTVRSYLPAYTYTGSHQLIDDGNYNWRLKLLTRDVYKRQGTGCPARARRGWRRACRPWRPARGGGVPWTRAT